MDNFKSYLAEMELKKRLDWYEKKYGPYIEKRGLKDNWKNLFRKPTLLEWTILFMLIMGLFSAWAYQRDIKACQIFYKENACNICSGVIKPEQLPYLPTNFSKLIIKEDLTGESGG
jgi:hypothetical protein